MNASQAAYVSRRDPRIVSYFKPYEEDDVVKLGDKDWQIKQGLHGWYLTDTGDYHGTHPQVRNVKGMIDLIRLVEGLFVRAQLQPA